MGIGDIGASVRGDIGASVRMFVFLVICTVCSAGGATVGASVPDLYYVSY
jgi:hypothetical protein